jgi:hypothetical protein
LNALKGKHHKKQNQQRAKDEVGNVPEITPTAISTDGDPANKNEKVVHKPPDSILSWWLLLTGIVVAIIYGLQLRAMLQSNEINRQSLVSVQRAFLTAQPVKPERLDAPLATTAIPSHSWSILGSYENSGTTPALEVVNYLQAGLADELTEDEFKGRAVSAFATTIGPRASQDVGPIIADEAVIFGRDLGKVPKLVRITDDRGRRMMVWGWAVYKDIFFPNSRPHLTEFCRKVDSLTTGADGMMRYAFTTCRSHNCTDESCPDYSEVVDSVAKMANTKPAP